jgi:hypothetical protein
MVISHDPQREDASPILALEHINLQIADQQLATLFYVAGLQLTRDPYLMVGVDNMWINVGRMQFHLPTSVSGSQRLRGVVGLVVPDLAMLETALAAATPHLTATQFGFKRDANTVEVVCPWGNRFRCHGPHFGRWGTTQLGLMYVDFDVPAEIFRAPVGIERNDEGLQTTIVRIGTEQRFNFIETSRPIPAYDGHHVQIYVVDFSTPYRRLEERNLISRNVGSNEWRFVDIVDPVSGDVVYQLEHEVRSMRHPLFGRSLVNRNPAQTNQGYVKSHDTFRGTY